MGAKCDYPENIQRHLAIAAEWLETGRSPYTESGTLVFVRALVTDVESSRAEVAKQQAEVERLRQLLTDIYAYPVGWRGRGSIQEVIENTLNPEALCFNCGQARETHYADKGCEYLGVLVSGKRVTP
jgi:hypothetical protein